MFGLKTGGKWQPFSGRWALAGQPCYIQRYASPDDLPEPPLLTDPQKQALARGGAYIGIIDRTHEVHAWSVTRQRWIQIMNICTQTASPGLTPGIPCVLCYRFIEDWGSAMLFPFLNATPTVESGVLYAQRDLTVYQVGAGTGQDAASRAMGDYPNPGPSAFGNGYWLYDPIVDANTTQDAPDDPILGTNTRVTRLGMDYRAGIVGDVVDGLQYRQRSRFFVDLAQIDPAGASKDWTEAQRDDYAFLLVNQATGEWRLWRNLDYRDTEPFRGISETPTVQDAEQGSLLRFFHDAHENSNKVSVYVVDTTKLFFGLALRFGWDVPSFGAFTGFEAEFNGQASNLNRDARQIAYSSSELTAWDFANAGQFLIRTVSLTGRSNAVLLDPIRRDIRKANRLASAEAVVPIDLSDSVIEVVTVPPSDAVSGEWFYDQDVVPGDNETAASGRGSTATPARIRIDGLNAERFTRFHMRFLGTPGATTKQSQWFGCLYRTLEDPRAFSLPPVDGGYFDPVTATSAVFRWSAVEIAGRPELDIEYDYSVATEGLFVTSGRTEELSVALTDLDPARIYTVQLSARVAARTGPSRSYTLVTLGTVQVPQNLNLKAMSLTSATFEVDPLDCIDAYQWVLEDEFGAVIQTRNTSEPKIAWSGLRPSRRYRQVVSAVQAGQSSQRTSLQFTLCLTPLYRGEGFTITLPETSATFAEVPSAGRTQYISCDSPSQQGNPSCQPPGSALSIPPAREHADCVNYIAAINVPTEPDFAGGKIAVIRPRIRVPVSREPINNCETGRVRAYPIDIEAKTGDLFTQAGFDALSLTGKSLYMRYDGDTFEVRGTWTFVSTGVIRLTPSFDLNARFTEETTRIDRSGRSDRWPPAGFSWIVDFSEVPFGRARRYASQRRAVRDDGVLDRRAVGRGSRRYRRLGRRDDLRPRGRRRDADTAMGAAGRRDRLRCRDLPRRGPRVTAVFNHYGGDGGLQRPRRGSQIRRQRRREHERPAASSPHRFPQDAGAACRGSDRLQRRAGSRKQYQPAGGQGSHPRQFRSRHDGRRALAMGLPLQRHRRLRRRAVHRDRRNDRILRGHDRGLAGNRRPGQLRRRPGSHSHHPQVRVNRGANPSRMHRHPRHEHRGRSRLLALDDPVRRDEVRLQDQRRGHDHRFRHHLHERHVDHRSRSVYRVFLRRSPGLGRGARGHSGCREFPDRGSLDMRNARLARLRRERLRSARDRGDRGRAPRDRRPGMRGSRTSALSRGMSPRAIRCQRGLHGRSLPCG